MRKVAIAALVLLCLAGGVAAYVMNREPVEWTTKSPEALDAFRRGLEADMKLYRNEARTHYEEALELDPDFVMARLQLLPLKELHGPELKQAREEFAKLDLSGLTPREQFIIRYHAARWNGDDAAAAAILQQYSSRHPRDSWALRMNCQKLWDAQDLPGAGKCYEKLLQTAPNWVLALNNLGYIAMNKGDFVEAEEAFRKYLFVAPDQANPHDSFGEMLTIVGRYEEAEKHLEQAIAIRPDFCDSYAHLIEVQSLAGDLDKAERTVARLAAQPSCARFVGELRCQVSLWKAADARDWAAIPPLVDGGCGKYQADSLVLGQMAALNTGNHAAAIALEEKLRPLGLSKQKMSGSDSMLLHLEGNRLASEGKTREAIARYTHADGDLPFWGKGRGTFKLFNLLMLARAQRAAGEEADAQRTLASIGRVNPRFVERFEAFTIPGHTRVRAASK
ncbi:MAG: tetratricopeptide repeat protein [Thermoanaerobaculia bacterium]